MPLYHSESPEKSIAIKNQFGRQKMNMNLASLKACCWILIRHFNTSKGKGTDEGNTLAKFLIENYRK